jgi:hypothetical protein
MQHTCYLLEHKAEVNIQTQVQEEYVFDVSFSSTAQIFANACLSVRMHELHAYTWYYQLYILPKCNFFLLKHQPLWSDTASIFSHSTPITLAAKRGNLEAMRLLLVSKADHSVVDKVCFPYTCLDLHSTINSEMHGLQGNFFLADFWDS